MTKEHKIIFNIAKLCGWIDLEFYQPPKDDIYDDFWPDKFLRGRRNKNDLWSCPPNYLKSLDACKEFEDQLSLDEKCEYASILNKLRPPPYDDFGCFASAEERCRAFLKVKKVDIS